MSPPPGDDSVHKSRLAIYSFVRMGGVLIFLLGVAIAYTNLVRPGGWPQVGAIIAIVGALDSLLLPRVVKRSWDRRDRGEQ